MHTLQTLITPPANRPFFKPRTPTAQAMGFKKSAEDHVVFMLY